MSRLNLTIADFDESYLESIVDFILSNHSKKFQINSFTRTDSLDSFLGNTVMKTDILLVSPEIYSSSTKKDCVNTVVLLINGRIPEDLFQIAAVNKYQHAEKLVNSILKAYWDNNSSEIFYPAGEKNTKIVAVYSPHGGSGKTTIAANLCKHCSEMGLQTFYLNLESFPSTDEYFTPQGGNGFSKILFYMKEKNKNLGLKIESLKCVDESGVFYFSPHGSSLELEEIQPDEFAFLIRQFRNINQYEIVVVDMGSGFDRQTEAIFKACDSIIVVLNQDSASRTKVKLFEKELDLFLKRENVNISGKVKLVLNKNSEEKENEYANSSFLDMHIDIKLPFVLDMHSGRTCGGSSFNSGINRLMGELL